MTVILSDGTVAKSGGKVIKNVAGYDLAKLFAGSYGTLGLIASVSVRLHPLPGRNATAIASGDDPARAGRGRRRARRAPAGGRLPRRRLGRRPRPPARALRRRRRRPTRRRRRRADARAGLGDARAEVEDDEIWNRQRALQRSADGIVLKVSGRPTDLPP